MGGVEAGQTIASLRLKIIIVSNTCLFFRIRNYWFQQLELFGRAPECPYYNILLAFLKTLVSWPFYVWHNRDVVVPSPKIVNFI